MLKFNERSTMKGTRTCKAAIHYLVCVLPTIGLAVLVSVEVHSWTPAKSLPRYRSTTRQTQISSALRSFKGETKNSDFHLIQDAKNGMATEKGTLLFEELLSILQLFFVSVGMSVILISWEDISMSHPMRMEPLVSLSTLTSTDSVSLTFPPEAPLRWGRSTVKGLASGGREREAIFAAGDLESSSYKNLPSYNEVMLMHRVNRIPLWNTKETDRITLWNMKEKNIIVAASRDDVVDSVRAIQTALLLTKDCQKLAQNYEWDELKATLNSKILRSDLTNACYILKGADEFLSREARDEIGFDWGSCAWRHCGALSDVQEAIDALEYQVGMLEPFECNFCLDVVERSLRDMLAVTNEYSDHSLNIPDYIPIQRMSEVSEQTNDSLDRQDTEYMTTLSVLRNSDF